MTTLSFETIPFVIFAFLAYTIPMKVFWKSLFFTLFVFGFAGWVYIVLNSEIHAQTLSMPLTHFLPFPREDTSGEISFVVSLVSFFFWNYIRYNDHEKKNK